MTRADNKETKEGLSPVDMYEQLIDDELFTLTEDDIDNAPEEFINEVLRRSDISPRSISTRIRNMRPAERRKNLLKKKECISDDNDTRDLESRVPEIQFPSLVEHICQAFGTYRNLFVYGPSHYGKTFFVKNQVICDPRIRERFPLCTWIDFFTLRMQSSRILERDAVWKLFGPEEESYHRFMYEIDGYKNDEATLWPLKEYIKRKHDGARGIIVLDHIECLNKSQEINKWFVNFVNFLGRRKISCIFIQREYTKEKSRFYEIMPLCYPFKMPRVDVKDINLWLDDPVFDEVRKIGVTPRDVDRASGGLVGVVHDFGAYLTNYTYGLSKRPERIFRFFVDKHSKQYSRLCDSLIQRVKEYPDITDQICNQFFETKGKIRDNIFDNLDENIKYNLLMTGCFKEDGNRLLFVCPAHRERLRSIIRPEMMIKSLYAGDMKMDIKE